MAEAMHWLVRVALDDATINSFQGAAVFTSLLNVAAIWALVLFA